jgi:hypothetical protein
MTRERLAMPRSNDDFAIYFAMMKAGYKPRPAAAPVEYARRLAIERLALQRRYCNAFEQWKNCKRQQCRRHESCRGDATACLKRTLPGIPHGVQTRARDRIIAATPRNIGAPEREARLSMPRDLYD